MGELGNVTWPAAPILTERLELRATAARDRDAYIDLLASEAVHRFLGGAQPRAELEARVPEVPACRPGAFAVDVAGAFIGSVTVDRRDGERPGGAAPRGGSLEIGYLFLPAAWGHGYATEAVRAVLGWIDEELPGEWVVLCTQLANQASVRLALRLGFVEVERFEEWGAEQWLGVRQPPHVRAKLVAQRSVSSGGPR